MKCRKHSPAVRVFYISLAFSNARQVSSATSLHWLPAHNNLGFSSLKPLYNNDNDNDNDNNNDDDDDDALQYQHSEKI